MKEGDAANQDKVKECIKTAEAAMSAQNDHRDLDGECDYITLKDAIKIRIKKA